MPVTRPRNKRHHCCAHIPGVPACGFNMQDCFALRFILFKVAG